MAAWFARVPEDAHWLITGGTRKGKSGLLQLLSRFYVGRGLDGLTALDPHGEFARAVFEWTSNPERHQLGRPVHLLDASGAYAFGLNPLDTFGDQSWEACHDAATTLTSVVESHFDASPETTPRLARIVYVASVLMARKQLSVLELLEFLSLGARELRRSLLEDFEHRLVKRELQDLAFLADKHPKAFYEFVESTRSRFLKWAADPRCARILGSKTMLNPRRCMDERAIVLVDLSALSYEDARFIGALFTATYFAAARKRPPLRCARHRLILDEAESLITLAVARMLDQTAKTGLLVTAAVQRLGQLRARGDFIADALFANSPVKVALGGLEPESANYVARTFFTGFLDLQEWKENTKRPLVVGQEKAIVRSESRTEHEAEHNSYTYARSHSQGDAAGTMTGIASAHGTSDFAGESAGMVMAPPASMLGPNAPNASFISYPLSTSSGASSGSGRSDMSSATTAESHTSFDMSGESEAWGHGKSRGTSVSEGLSEVFISTFAWLPTQLYSLEEQWHRVEAELMNLPRRECYVRIEAERPFKTRTADLTPAFKSLALKAEMVPRFLATTSARSPYLAPTDDVDRDIAARLVAILNPAPPPIPAEPVTAAQPIANEPTLDPIGFATNVFWRKRAPSAEKPKSKKGPPSARPPRKPRPTLTLIDGGKDGDNEKGPR